jgi:hypothetical protein
MVSDPWPLADNGISLGDVGSFADFGSISHMAVYDSHEPALQRIQADMGHLPTLTGGRYVEVPTSSLSYYLGRPTVAIVCNDPMHVLVGGPVQRVWMGAWSGTAATAVTCEAQPSVPFRFQWPWSPSEPSGADTRFWNYRAVVSVAINFSPLEFPPGSVAEDSLRIDIEEELSALMVHINPARIEANLVADEALNELEPPALRLRVTFTPQRDDSGPVEPWGPVEFHAHSALNSAVAAAEQLQTMLQAADQSVFGDRLWQLMPEAAGLVTLEAEAPCVHAEGGFAKACSADEQVLPGFIVAGVLVTLSVLAAMLAAIGEFDKCCPDASGALDSLRAADPGLNGDMGRLGFDPEHDGSVASGSGGEGGGGHSGSLEPAVSGAAPSTVAGGKAVPQLPKILSQVESDGAWIPVSTDGSLVDALRAIRDERWLAARASSRAIIANSGSGPTLVPPGARAGSPMTTEEIGVVVRTTLQAPRTAMIVIPIATAAVVLTNTLVLIEFCLEQNGLGAIVTGLGLLGWLACNVVAACARHSSLLRPLWERGEGAPASPTSMLAPLLCCFCGPKTDAGGAGACAQASGMACNLAFCWPCFRRLTCCQWVCGNGGPSACARDTFGLGCACARSLVTESDTTPRTARSIDNRGFGSGSADGSAAGGPGLGAGSLGQPSTFTLGSGSINGAGGGGGSIAAPSESGAGGGGGGTLAGASWATNTASTVARRRYEWTLATSMSGGLCGCIGAEMVRGLMRRNGDSGAESWQRFHPCWYAISAPASIVFGPIWLQLHMSRAMPWGCCAMTWSVDADYAEAGADSLRRQTILGALVLGACVVSYGFASVISTSVLTADTVPTQWTTHLNLGLTLAWLLYLIISALFSRFAAVDDDDARYAVLAAGSDFDSVMMSTARGGRAQPLGSLYSDRSDSHRSSTSSYRVPAPRAAVHLSERTRAVDTVPEAGGGGGGGGRGGPVAWGAAVSANEAVATEDEASSQVTDDGAPSAEAGYPAAVAHNERTRDPLAEAGVVAMHSRGGAPTTTYAVAAGDAAGMGGLNPRGEIHAGGALRDDSDGAGGVLGGHRGIVASVLVPDGAYLPGTGRAAGGRVILPPLPPGTAGVARGAPAEAAGDEPATIDAGGGLR